MIQKFEEYINEKLTLDDISKMNPKGNWVDAKSIRVEDITVGSIIEVAMGYKYIYIPTELAKKQCGWNWAVGDFTLIRRDMGSISTYGYLHFRYHNFPKYDNENNFNIVKIKLREKDYTTKKEIDTDLDKLYKFGDIY